MARTEKANEALVVLEQRFSTVLGTSRQVFSPFDIVPHPTGLDSQLLADASAELDEWWGGELGEPERIDGGLWPALVRRPRDGSLWVRPEPLRLVPLGGASRQLACQAILRSRSTELLAQVSRWSSDPAVRTAAAECLAAGATGQPADPQKPLLLGIKDRRAYVVLTNGDERLPEDFHARSLQPLISDCSDQAVVQALAASDYQPLARLAEARVAELAASQPDKPSGKRGRKAASPEEDS